MFHVSCQFLMNKTGTCCTHHMVELVEISEGVREHSDYSWAILNRFEKSKHSPWQFLINITGTCFTPHGRAFGDG